MEPSFVGPIEPLPPPARPLDPLLVTWTRTLLWLTMIVATLRGLHGLQSIVEQFQWAQALRLQRTRVPEMWMTPQFLFFCLERVGADVLVVFAAHACLRFRPRARTALMVGMWLWIGVWLLNLLRYFETSRGLTGILQWLYFDQLVLPIIVLLFLSRPVVRRQFNSDADRAFEPILPEASPATREGRIR